MAGLPTVNFTEVVSMESVLNTIPELLSSCGGEVVSLSVCPTHQFIAVATAEKTQVPRYSDHVKVYSYKQSAQLLDKLPAQRPSHLQWLHVPYQTWLVFMQNNSTLQLFHFQGVVDKASASVDAKMRTAKQKAFCVIEYGRSELTTVVQSAFRMKYGVQPPDRWCIKRWYKLFIENGCLCKGKISGRPRTSDDNVARIYQAFVCSPGKLTRKSYNCMESPMKKVSNETLSSEIGSSPLCS
ncbi:hypothetical protein J6590_006981 [Homalodisca vitripennis]|nr:hypothetical protein J6590_006981 [Homalodisca vitripennis]